MFRVLVEAVAYVGVGYAGVFEEEADGSEREMGY